MGHDISGFTQDGHRIKGPHFSRYWFPHYGIFDAWQHNAGVSGSGGSEPVTPESLQRARQVCLERLERAQQRAQKIEEEIRNILPSNISTAQPPRPASGKPKFFMLVPGDPENSSQDPEQGEPAPRLIQLRDLLDPSDWGDDEPTPPEEDLQFACSEVKTYREILDFIDRCLAESAVRIKFW